MEMSRQRLRPSLAEASLVTCPHCAGMGHVRSAESAALHILRAIEDEGAKFRSAEIAVSLPPEVALYLFNHKRDRLAAIEARYAMRVIFNGDASLTAANYRIEKLRAQTAPLPVVAPARAAVAEEPELAPEAVAEAEDESEGEAEEETPASAGETAEEGERRRRRRRRRGKRRPETGAAETAADVQPDAAQPEAPKAAEPVDEPPSEIDLVIAAEIGEQPEPGAETGEPARRRRSRGSRRRRPAGEGEAAPSEAPAPEPFFGDVADIFEAAERAEAEALRVRAEARLSAAPAAEPAATPELHVAVHFEPAAEPDVAAEGAAIEAQAAAEPEAPEPAAPEPLVKPILVGADAPVQEKKRGWWRR
jgi:ribonuclease E